MRNRQSLTSLALHAADTYVQSTHSPTFYQSIQSSCRHRTLTAHVEVAGVHQSVRDELLQDTPVHLSGEKTRSSNGRRSEHGSESCTPACMSQEATGVKSGSSQVKSRTQTTTAGAAHYDKQSSGKSLQYSSGSQPSECNGTHLGLPTS